ncbi:Beta-1 adrenergic receptor [Trichoplax sp. H2]|nr:Beta-1 adrenergic receptor [Trichoplax sp. H2]|eukprot:RDD41446.1 Beta-1 adrenergic receptor [Trichoplax sp. H2]
MLSLNQISEYKAIFMIRVYAIISILRNLRKKMTMKYTYCLDVRYFLKLNLTYLVYRQRTPFENDLTISWSVLAFAILLSNLFLLAIICSKRSAQTNSNILIASLCTANILYVFCYILPAKLIILGNSVHPIANIYCQLLSTVVLFAFNCSINFHICAVSLVKFLAVTAPFWYNQSDRNRSVIFTLILLLCWILPVIVAFIPLIIGWWRICPYFCSLSESLENRKVSLQVWHIFWSILTFLLPAIIIIILYIRILLAAKGYIARVQTAIQTSNLSIPSSFNSSWKATKTVMVIVGVYLLLQTPYNIYQIINISDKSLIRNIRGYYIRDWLFYLSSWNSVISPIIYGYFKRNLRNRIVAIFSKRRHSSSERQRTR